MLGIGNVEYGPLNILVKKKEKQERTRFAHEITKEIITKSKPEKQKVLPRSARRLTLLCEVCIYAVSATFLMDLRLCDNMRAIKAKR